MVKNSLLLFVVALFLSNSSMSGMISGRKRKLPEVPTEYSKKREHKRKKIEEEKPDNSLSETSEDSTTSNETTEPEKLLLQNNSTPEGLSEKEAKKRILALTENLIETKTYEDLESLLTDPVKWLAKNAHELFSKISISFDTENVVFSEKVNLFIKETAVFHAIEKNKKELFPLLFGKFNLVDIRSSYFNYTPLHKAINRGNFDLAEYLCRLGANVNATALLGGTPLHFALRNKNLKLVQLLLAHNAQTNIDDGFDNTPLSEAVTGTDDCEILRLIHEKSEWTVEIREDLLSQRKNKNEEFEAFIKQLPLPAPESSPRESSATKKSPVKNLTNIPPFSQN